MTKLALITGGNRGLGYETARLLGENGFQVILGSRDSENGTVAANQLVRIGIDATSVPIDVTEERSVKTAAAEVGERFGRLDLLVNNAGVLPEATEPSDGGPANLELFRTTFETNLFGAVAVTREFLPLLERSDQGQIINVSTTMGSLQEQLNPESPYFGLVLPAYQGSKAALNGFTIALAKSLRETNIRVNSVCPGWIQTDLGGADNRAAAPMTAAQGAEIIVDMATTPAAHGTTGTFVDREGIVAW